MEGASLCKTFTTALRASEMHPFWWLAPPPSPRRGDFILRYSLALFCPACGGSPAKPDRGRRAQRASQQNGQCDLCSRKAFRNADYILIARKGNPSPLNPLNPMNLLNPLYSATQWLHGRYLPLCTVGAGPYGNTVNTVQHCFIAPKKLSIPESFLIALIRTY